MNTYTKDPGATLDYTVDFTAWLGTDTIATASVTTPPGLTEASESNTTTKVTVWLSGGTVGQSYTVTCRITTVAGRIDERSLLIRVRDK